MVINIQDDILKLHALGLLDRLLSDKTTKKNIIWASDAYLSYGSEYSPNRQITKDLIVGQNSDLIKTRARKAMEQRAARTRQHAEVFTPVCICRQMNDYADETWFGYKNVFFIDDIPTERVFFPKKKKWHRYVDSRRLEITCGEGPYLVSRYDVETGEMLPVKSRVGILDRKLRVVSENTNSENEWVDWAIRAVQATYGFEYQGDNVLIARVNVLMTFEEHLEEHWHRKPTIQEYEKLCNVICWNIWQMDGLAGTVPLMLQEESYYQETIEGFFDDYSDTGGTEKIPCRIYDWRGKASVEYNRI